MYNKVAEVKNEIYKFCTEFNEEYVNNLIK